MLVKNNMALQSFAGEESVNTPCSHSLIISWDILLWLRTVSHHAIYQIFKGITVFKICFNKVSIAAPEYGLLCNVYGFRMCWHRFQTNALVLAPVLAKNFPWSSNIWPVQRQWKKEEESKDQTGISATSQNNICVVVHYVWNFKTKWENGKGETNREREGGREGGG